MTLELTAGEEGRRAAQLVLDEEGRIVVVYYGCGASVQELAARGGPEIPLSAPRR